MVDWGDVPGWIQAGATVALLVAAVIAGVLASRIYKIESARDRRYAEERQKDQASLVSAWVERRDSALLLGEGAAGPGHFLILKNASVLPVYDVSVRYFIPEASKFVEHSHPIGLLVPGERAERIARPADAELGKLKLMHSSLRVHLSFIDSHGQRWQRPPDGGLELASVVSHDRSGRRRWMPKLRTKRMPP
jgi:hypothetical protein